MSDDEILGLVLGKLDGVEQHAGYWMARCPAHDDGKPSLSVGRGTEQPVVLHCHAECDYVAILAAIGLTPADISRPQEDRRPDDEWMPGNRRAVAVYDYTDERGKLLFQVLRSADKHFSQRHPDPAAQSGWAWNMKGVTRVPYRLPQIRKAATGKVAGRVVYIAEGEKDVHALEAAGVIATCNPMGAGKWRPEFGKYLAGIRHAIIVADKDDPGREHAFQVRERISKHVRSVSVVEAAEGKDAADHLAAGHSLHDFVPVMLPSPGKSATSAASAGQPVAAAQDSSPSDGGGGDGKRSQATMLRQLARERFRLVNGDDGKPYAVAKDGPSIVRPLRGKTGLRNLLSKLYADVYGAVPSQSALTDAVTALEGEADGADVEPVYLRVAPHEGGVVLDLGTPDGRCIIVTPAQGWRQASKSPVLFRRTRLIGVMPDPIDGGTLAEFRTLFNVDDYQWPLVVGWLVGALIPDIPHPILSIVGEQGTAKSSAAKMLVLLIDPSAAPLRTQPRDLKSWATQAAASWTVCLDNVSSIQPWLSDALCRAATGDGLVDRMLYSDDDVNVLSFRRAVALTAIGTDALRGDLAERLLPVDLARIGDESRRAEAEVMRLFEDVRRQALGAILTLLSKVLGELPAIRLERMPRMADFARILAALDNSTGWKSRDAYEGTADEIAESVIESDHFAEHVRAFIDKLGPQPWRGTVGQLFELLTPEKPPKKWPETIQGARTELRRVAPALRMRGYTIEPLQRTGKARPWLLASASEESQETAPKTSSQSSSSSRGTAGLREHDDDASDDGPAAPLSSLPITVPDLRKSGRDDDCDDDDDASRKQSPVPSGETGGYPGDWPEALSDDHAEWSA